MTDIEPRKTQTKVKHTILEKYLKAWGGIISNGWGGKSATLHLVYIDCNASSGRYSGELEDAVAKRDPQPIYGSPIIGVRVLDELASGAREKGRSIRTNAIFFEHNQAKFDELKQSLHMAGLAHRIRETEDFFSLQNGEIALLCKDSTSMASQLIRYTQSSYTKFSFFTLDPYGPKGIPLSFVGEIVHQPHHDVLINMPYNDLHRKKGIVPKQNQTPVDEKLLSNYDEMFGNKDWQAIVRALDMDAMRQGQEALRIGILPSNEAMTAVKLELELMDCYKRSLLSIDPELTVKSIGLHFSDKRRTIYYLYLTTHDPTGALAMNKVLWEAGYQEHELKWELMRLSKWESQLTLIAPELQTKQRTTTEEIAAEIRCLFRGKTLTKRDIFRALEDRLYFYEEVNKALTSLKRQKQASFGEDQGIRTRITIT